MRHLIYFIISMTITLMAIATGCKPGQQPRGDTKSGSGSRYTLDRAMSIYDREPDKALAVLDSAVIMGNADPITADIMRARIFSSSCETRNLDTALRLCEKLVKLKDVQQNKDELFNVLEQLVDITRQQQNDEQLLHWARQLTALCHERGDTVEALRTKAEIGLALCHLGNREEGMETLDQAITQLDKASKFNPLDAYIVAAKRKIVALNEGREYSEVIPLAKSILGRLADYEAHPEAYNDHSYRMPNNATERDKYIKFYQAQAYSYIAYASARKHNMQEARYYTRLFEQSDLGHTYLGRTMIAPTWFELRETDKMLAIYNEAKQVMGNDTINDEYALMLRCLAIAAHDRGDYALSQQYWRRQAHLSHLLTQQKLNSKAHEYAARFHAQEQQLALQRSQSKAAWLWLLAISCLVIALLTSGFAVYFFKQQRIMNEKNRVLVEQIAWTIESNIKYLKARDAARVNHAVSEKQEDADSTWLQQLDSEQLFQFLSHEIIQNKLYLDPTISRQTIINTYHLNERAVGSAFSHSKYASFPNFIRTCRLHHACLLLENHPQMSISEVATSSGFTNLSVFCRDFKNKFTVTPTVYRCQRKAND
ncbi:MAG: helix-turn-helix domain-containing protein [Muribaculaceae bacterium]|nr:helix-turn-helix domain-containing protein [Muribaculaceae bacterium]